MLRAVMDSFISGFQRSSDIYNKWLYFPASGYRNYSNGGANNVGSYGYCWSAVPNNQNNGRNLNFNSSNVNPLNNNNRAYGFGVRLPKNLSLYEAGNPLNVNYRNG